MLSFGEGKKGKGGETRMPWGSGLAMSEFFFPPQPWKPSWVCTGRIEKKTRRYRSGCPSHPLVYGGRRHGLVVRCTDDDDDGPTEVYDAGVGVLRRGGNFLLRAWQSVAKERIWLFSDAAGTGLGP